MAQKDWKKMKGVSNRWESDNDQIDVAHTFDKGAGRKGWEWRVTSIYGGWDKYFKTKSQAMTFARRYMITHRE